MMDKKFLISAIIALGLTALGLFLLARVSQFSGPAARLKLSDFPEVFGKDALIVIGDETCERELRAAKEIAEYLKNVTGNEPEIKRCSEIAAEDKRNYNLMVIGTPESNKMLREIYGISDALGVNESFPGEGKGVLEILPNPWNKDRAMLLVEGKEYRNPDPEWRGRGVEIMKQILLQESNLKKVKVSGIYGPYDGWHPNLPPGMEGFPDPAALYCKKLGYCGSEKCNPWQFFSGLCEQEHTYCSRTGGVLVLIKNWCPFAPVCSVCILPKGKICYEFDYAMGACG